jgi:hypothetical protein
MMIYNLTLPRIRNISEKFCRKNQNTNFIFRNFLFQIRAVYEIMWKNIVQPGRQQMEIWRMRFACLIPKDTNTFLCLECIRKLLFQMDQILMYKL